MNTGYVFTIENYAASVKSFYPLWERQYGEMTDRLEREGVRMPPLKPRIEQYAKANEGGWMFFYTVRFDGEPVGNSIVYLTNDMHNGDLIAKEDTIYIVPEHRNGVGRQFAKFILRDLKRRGARRMMITAVTDPRAGKLWQRMGFRPIGQVMSLDFKDVVDVRT